jgi:hypothetical protein
MLLVVQIVAVAFMLTLMFVGIWSFIILNQIFGQLRYRNYILEKLTQNIYMIASRKDIDNICGNKDMNNKKTP